VPDNSPSYWDNKYQEHEKEGVLWTWDRTHTWEKVTEAIVASFEDCYLLTVVDLGCGIGTFCHYLAENLPDDGQDIYGIDISPWAIQYAKKNSVESEDEWKANLYFMVGEASKPPFASGTVDVFCMNECLEHLENPLEALQQLYLLLDNDGIVVITTPHDGRIGNSTEHYSKFGHNNLFHLLMKAGFGSVVFYPLVNWFEGDSTLMSILAVARK
jgi:SAM-dependent methyltransferase